MMHQVVISDDVEQLLCDYLTDALTAPSVAPARLLGASVGTKVPKDRPPLFVRLWVSGGIDRNLIQDEPLVTVESWGQDEGIASELAAYVGGFLLAIDSWAGVEFYDVEGAGRPVSLPDPLSGTDRYVALYKIPFRKRAIN